MDFEKYNPRLKELARDLRNNSTKAEIKLWRYLRNKRLLGLDFHRQKPLGNYIADFYCPKARLVVEVDGRSHLQSATIDKDRMKEDYLGKHKILILRVKNEEVMNDTGNVLRKIENAIKVQFN